MPTGGLEMALYYLFPFEHDASIEYYLKFVTLKIFLCSHTRLI